MSKPIRTSYLYHHRMMRLFNYLQGIKAEKKSELMARSAMMCGLLSYGHSSKLELEGGTLSYLPQYSEFDRKKVMELFGADVKNLVMEVRRVCEQFNADTEVDYDVVRGFSLPAKNVYIYQCYVDLIDLLTGIKERFMLDGRWYELKDGKVLVGGDPYPIQDFHQYWMETLKWKLNLLEFCNLDIKQALEEVMRQYREQKGYIFDTKFEFVEASADQSASG